MASHDLYDQSGACNRMPPSVLSIARMAAKSRPKGCAAHPPPASMLNSEFLVQQSGFFPTARTRTAKRKAQVRLAFISLQSHRISRGTPAQSFIGSWLDPFLPAPFQQHEFILVE